MSILRRYWIVLFGILYGAYVSLPFLAPVLMHIGWKAAGNAIYFIYSFLCHQLPQRSYFLFGPRFSYSLADLKANGLDISDFFTLRKFIGNPQMGWKVAWSDRMISLYTPIWLFGLTWWPLRRKIPKLPAWILVLFLLPMAIDGTSHLVSDLAGMGLGFREMNQWLVNLSHHAFSPGFYVGDAWGSFNSITRLVTGALFGVGIAWLLFPMVNETFIEP